MSDDTAFAEIAHAIASRINFETNDSFRWPVNWPHRFRVIEPELGARLIVKETSDQELREVKIEHLSNCIVAWLRLQNDPETLLTSRKAKEAAETWMAFAEPLPMECIKPLRWKSEPGHTWRRLPWDQVDGPTPTWDKILSKMTNAAALRQWLGSLFFEQAAQHQYVWVHGMGNDGKGSMNRFLKRVFGRSYRSKQPPALGDKFWTHGLIGSRLVVFPDCNSQGFTTGGLFKSLSGGDPVDVEAKGRMSFTTELQCKFLFFSNEKPTISCEDADMRRIIYCEFFEKTKKEDSDPNFEKKLWDEGGAFLTKCVKEYQKNCPNNENIQSDREDIETWVSVGEERFSNIFNAYFVLSPKLETYQSLAEMTDDELDKISIEPNTLLKVIQVSFSDKREQAGFRDWLYKKYGVQKRGIRRRQDDKDTVVYRYVGINKHAYWGVEELDRKVVQLSTAINRRHPNPLS